MEEGGGARARLAGDTIALSDDSHLNMSLAGSIQLGKENPLPRPQSQPSAANRHRDAGASDYCAQVAGGVVIHAVVAVGAVVRHGVRQPRLQIAEQARLGFLNQHAGRRVRTIDDRQPIAHALARASERVGDVKQLRPLR